MARARLKHTGKAKGRRGQPPKQPTCGVCGEPIEPGQDRYEWSFRYGGTYQQHAFHGAPRPSQTTQGSVSQLYAAQEAIEDAIGADEPDYEAWRSNVEQALNDAAETAREMQSEYEYAAEPFGGAGPNQERAEACEEWADELENAASEVANVEVEDVDEPEHDSDDTSDEAQTEREAYEEAVEQAQSNARDEAGSIAENASGNLGI